MTVFEVGSGGGRNLTYFLREGYEVFAIDRDQEAIARTRRLKDELAPGLPDSNFRVESIEETTFPEGSADFLISCAVLHFARSDEEFGTALDASWRLLAPGGIFFCRLASRIGMEGRVRRLGGRRYLQPDGTERYLVDEKILLDCTARLGGELIDPIKTTVVQNQRCMTTWVVWKPR